MTGLVFAIALAAAYLLHVFGSAGVAKSTAKTSRAWAEIYALANGLAYAILGLVALLVSVSLYFWNTPWVL